MDFMIIFFGLLLSYTILRTIFSHSEPKNLPPGPPPFPVVGNLHLLGAQPHRSLAELAKTHGPIMFLRLGQIPTVVISSAAASKQVLQTQDLAFSGRHVPDALNAHDIFKSSVIWLPAAATEWRNIRKIFKTYIFSADRLDAKRHLHREKVRELVAFCRGSSQSGDAVDVGQAAFRTTLNLLSNTIFSKDLTDPFRDSARDFKDMVVNLAMDAGKPNLADFFPALRMIDPQGVRRRMSNHLGKMFELFDGLISERLEMKESGRGGENDDVLDVCLNVCEMNRTQMKGMFFDLFAAGTVTLTSTLEWAMAEVLRSPQTMAKAKEELSQVIGKEKMIEEADVSRLPYLQCIIKEVLRMHPAGPLLVPRKVETDLRINDYTIPKGAQVLVNVWAIGRDPTVWEDSFEFKPERFLSSKLDVRGQNFELIPFGAGRRICPGMPLVIRMLPVMLGSLLNNFSWKLDGGIEPKDLDMEEKFGLTLEKVEPLRAIPLPLV